MHIQQVVQQVLNPTGLPSARYLCQLRCGEMWCVLTLRTDGALSASSEPLGVAVLHDCTVHFSRLYSSRNPMWLAVGSWNTTQQGKCTPASIICSSDSIALLRYIRLLFDVAV